MGLLFGGLPSYAGVFSTGCHIISARSSRGSSTISRVHMDDHATPVLTAISGCRQLMRLRARSLDESPAAPSGRLLTPTNFFVSSSFSLLFPFFLAPLFTVHFLSGNITRSPYQALHDGLVRRRRRERRALGQVRCRPYCRTRKDAHLTRRFNTLADRSYRGHGLPRRSELLLKEQQRTSEVGLRTKPSLRSKTQRRRREHGRKMRPSLRFSMSPRSLDNGCMTTSSSR